MKLPLDTFGNNPEGWDIEIDDGLVARWDAAVTSDPVQIATMTMNLLNEVGYDSIDREALFLRACARFDLDYEVVYQAWLHLPRLA